MIKTRTTLWILVIVGIISIGIFWSQRNKPIPVTLATVEKGIIEKTVTNTRAGTLKSCRRAKLSPALGGLISQLPVREGDQVQKGVLLFEIWNEDLSAQVKLAQAQLASSQSLQKQSCVQADLAKREAERISELLKRRLTSEDAADKAAGEAQAQEAACSAAQSNVATARAQLDVAQAALHKTRLTAPFDGIVAEVNGEIGEYVTPSPVGVVIEPVVDLLVPDCLYISAPIDEVDAPSVRTAMNARISLDAFNTDFFDGKVKRIAPYVMDKEKQARTVDIEVEFNQLPEDLHLLPGYTADVEVIINTHDESLRIPSEALLEGNQVYRYVEATDQIEKIKVKTGLGNWAFTEIIDGLQENDRIVSSIDRDGLADGVIVKAETP